MVDGDSFGPLTLLGASIAAILFLVKKPWRLGSKATLASILGSVAHSFPSGGKVWAGIGTLNPKGIHLGELSNTASIQDCPVRLSMRIVTVGGSPPERPDIVPW